MIDANQRGRFFTHLRTTVDQALRTPGVHETQPHRQIYYLMQWDHHADTRAWLEAVQRVEQRRWRIADGWTPQWVTARSMAVTYARHGDADPLRWFIETAMRDEEAQDADLNYWAYWVGEVPTVQRSDEFMAGGLGPWRGDLLLRRFYDGLVPDERSLDLYAHSARALIQRRPRLLTEGPDLAAALQLRLETLLDAGELNPSTKRALEDIRFGLRLVGIPKPPM